MENLRDEDEIKPDLKNISLLDKIMIRTVMSGPV